MQNNQQYSEDVVRANVIAHYMEIEARTTHLKAQSNLQPNPEFELKGDALRRGVLGLIKGAYKEPPEILWLSLALCCAFPQEVKEVDVAKELRIGKTFKSLRDATRKGTFAAPSSIVSLTRNSNSFSVTVPFLMVERTVLYRWARTATQKDPVNYFDGVPFTPDDNGVGQLLINSKQAILRATDGRSQQLLNTCVKNIEVAEVQGDFVFQMTLEITKAEAQYMTNKRWETIRPIDLYAIFTLWVDNGLGSFAASPTQVFALSTVTRTLPKDPNVLSIKVNDQQLTCSHDGNPLFIPKDCDNTAEYEAALTRAGNIHADGTFNMARVGEPSPTLPINVPVLTDWLNNKFAYTNTSGKLAIQNLTNCRVANSVHISSWLKRVIDDRMFKRVFNLAMSGSGATFNVKSTDFDDGVVPSHLDINDLTQYVNTALKINSDKRITWGDIAYNSAIQEFRPIGRYFREVYKDVLSNLESVFHKYSVEHTMAVLPYIILIGHYAPKAGQIDAEANTINSAAINQHGSPDYNPKAPELWSGDCGLQPHQRRIAEKLSGSPAFAILPVPAGGGKTPTIIFDILDNMHKGIGAPYLIMCPSHLVAQYIKEVNFFTKGRLNVIPIMTRVYNIHGEKRLTDVMRNAPRNTVVVCDYDAIKRKAVSVCYGVENVNVFPIAELLKQFSFGYVALDESHYVKNGKSARARACMGLIADIPMKRLASGTMAHDSPSDLASQIAMLDPTIFGSKDSFNARFGADFKGDRVISWRPGYEAEVKRMIRERIVDGSAHRREWAALLPPASEEIHPVDMTDAQRAVYESILKETLDEIKKNATLAKRLEDAKETEGAEDDDQEDDLVALLQPYIARLEQFICAPDKDPLGNELLKGDDRISPKVHVINELIRTHIEEKRPGKILIFTNYQMSAEHIYENLLPQYQRMAIHYHASNKVEDGAAFEKDPRKLILVGVENSMNTGLNLQFAALLIRVETVWNPGTLEQGNSRINRPSLKVADKRNAIYYRWIVCDRSIDVTKMSRLTAKIVTVAKFENDSSPEYKRLPDLPIIPLTLDTIATDNSWGTTLRNYGAGYREYRLLVRDEYMKYKEEYHAKYGTEIMKYPGDGGTSKDGALADNIPWVPGLEIAAETQLNLIRVDQFLRLEATNFESEEEDSKAVDDNEWRRSMAKKLIGQQAFCEFGQGVITGVALRVGVLIIDIGRHSYHRIKFAASYVFGKPLKISVRKNQMKYTGMSLIETTKELPAIGVKSRTTLKEVQEEVKEKKEVKVKKKLERAIDMSVTLEMVSTNGFLGLRVHEGTASNDVLDVLSAHGFSPELPSRRARMKTAKMLNEQMWKWVDKGYSIVPEMVEDGTLGAFESMMGLLKSKQISQDKMLYKFVTKQQLRNFYRYERKPVKQRKQLMIYPVIEDGLAYIYMPMRGQAGNRSAIRVRAPGVIWEETPKAISWFALRPAQIKAMVHKLMDAGLVIKNGKKLSQQYQKLRKGTARRNVETEDIDMVD